MSARRDQNDVNDDARWWRLDFSMVLLLLVLVVLFLLITFEFWHAHPGLHRE